MNRLTFIMLLLIASCQTADKHLENEPSVNETSVTVQWDTAKYVLNHCTATVEGTTLTFTIEHYNEQQSDLFVQGSQKNNEILLTVSQPWSLTDSSYVSNRFRILNQSVVLDKKSYKKGETLQGQLKLLLLGHKAYFREEGEMKPREHWDTIHVFGIFSSTVR